MLLQPNCHKSNFDGVECTLFVVLYVCVVQYHTWSLSSVAYDQNDSVAHMIFLVLQQQQKYLGNGIPSVSSFIDS